MSLPQYLFVDYETFSLADLGEVGLDNYAKDPSTGISCLGWAEDMGEIQLWLPHLGNPPERLLMLLREPTVLKIAWSAMFECSITNHVFPRITGETMHIPITKYRDPIVLAHALSLPGKLDSVAQILRMKELKDPRGEELKMMFCAPVSKGGELTLFGIAPPLFRDHLSHPKEFAEYTAYCKQDVRAERDLWYRLLKITLPQRDWDGWYLDQKINFFGMPGRRDLAEKALRLAKRYITEARQELKTNTGLENPNSDVQMKKWVTERGYSWNSLRANYVQAELDNKDSPITAECRAALVLRGTARKSSYTKLERFLAVLSKDDRLRHQFKYMAAARTGRWAGGDVQVQNLPRGVKVVKKNLDKALKLLAAEDYDAIKREFPKITVIDFVITLLRSMFQATPGKKIVVADLNAIENRVLGWVAGCKSILDVFRTCNSCGYLFDDLDGPFCCPKCGCLKSRCPYISFGTRMYEKSYEEMWAAYEAGNEEERQNSKPAVLGAGYGLGGGEMRKNEYGDMVRGGLWGYAKNVCGVDMPQELAHKSVKIFREAYTEVGQLWTDFQEAFKQVLLQGGRINVGEVTWNKAERKWEPHKTFLGCVISFTRKPLIGGGYLMCMHLPSGRILHYMNATVEQEERIGKDKITGKPRVYHADVLKYDGIEHSATQDDHGQTIKKKHKWGRVKTYGGKLCENAVQAISRDLLLNGMILADEMGFHLFGMFHDELAGEEEDDIFSLTVQDLIYCMTVVPDWAPGLLLGAEGFESAYYKKG